MSDMGWTVGAGRYPLARRRRSRWRRAARRWRGLPQARLLAGLILAAALAIGGLAWRDRQGDPRASFRSGLAALREGRFAAAQAALTAALPAEPARAEVALARLAIERGDAAAAAIALQRAAAAGTPATRLHQLRAAAMLLDGDTDGARQEAAAAPAPYHTFANRVVARALADDGDLAGALGTLAAVTARRPGDAGAWTDLGTVRLAASDVPGASDAAARALAIDPHAPAALVLQGRLVRLRYGPTASLPWFAAALGRDGAFVPALVEDAATLAEVGRTTRALAAARAALAARPDLPQPLYVLAVIAARADRPALARRLLQRVDVDAMPGTMLLGGWLDLAEGHPDLAIARWQRLLAAQPYNLVVRRLLARALLGAGDAQGALDAAAPLTARGDADAYVLEVAARAARLLGRHEQAATLHDRAIGDRRQPSGAFDDSQPAAALAARDKEAPGPDASVALVRGLLTSGAGGAAVARAQAIVRAAPQVAAARLVLGDALVLTGRDQAAAQVYAGAANLAFDEPTALRLIDASARTGRDRAAATALALYLAQNPVSPVARRIAGHWQAVAGAPAAAATLARLAVEGGGRDAAVLADLALATRDPARAVRIAAAAYRLTPMRLDVVRVYATVLARAGQGDGARQLQAKARALARAGG